MKVIGIMGQSYTGSSVVNYLLNAAPGVYGGSELRRLRDGSGGGLCALCRTACRIWTPEALKTAGRADSGSFYRIVSDVTGSDMIVDSSKLRLHFSGPFLESSRDAGVEFHFFAITRHPFTHVASHLYNGFAKKKNRIDSFVGAQRLLADDPEQSYGYAERTLASIQPFIGDFFSEAAPAEAGIAKNHFRLEDVIDNQTDLYAVAGEFFGFDPTFFSQTDWTGCEAHPIGGNMGPLSQLRSYTGRKSGRLSYYEKHKGLFHDEKWKLFMARDLSRAITASPVYRTVCADLGYDANMFDAEISLLA